MCIIYILQAGFGSSRVVINCFQQNLNNKKKLKNTIWKTFNIFFFLQFNFA